MGENLERAKEADVLTALNRQTHALDVELLATIVHDLGNPLTIVQLTTQLLRGQAQHACAPPSPWLDRGLAQIDEAGMRMAKLLDEIVGLVQIQSGDSLHVSRRSTDLAELAARAAAEAQSTSERRGVRLELAEPSLIGRWDVARLRRVLENLLSNAIKYSPPDRDIVVRVTRDVTFDGDWAVLVVRDFGRGISADDQAHIFEPFWRGSNVGQVAGNGLGLVSVKQSVEAHGGSIAVESCEGEGTTFTVRLPLD